jgi:long-chain fatty acid transport protein
MATDGYFSHAYGMKGKGMAGAATAMAQDTFGGANNPASMVFVGDRVDAGIDWFSPVRSAERSGAGIPSLNGKVDSDSENFFIPEFGYNKMLNPNLSLGVTVYGNGGMNTDYPQGNFNCGAGPSNILCGNGRIGVDLSQLIVAPTVAFKFHPNHSVGVSPLFGYQRFKAEGLQAFDNPPGFPPFTGSPGNVTNRGYDSSTGWGVRVGYMGQLTSSVTLGAAYATKMSMSKFDKYKGLFADDGKFDIPEHYSVGLAFKPVQPLTIALDYERINYSGVPSVGNPSTIQAPLGSANGPGFGWQDVDIVKLGVAWQYNPQWTFRVGYNHSDNPILARDVTFNILAPGVVQDHLTLGFSYALSADSEITMAYMHAFENSVTGPSLFNNLFGPGAGGNEKIQMYENSLGIAWGTKF